MSNVSNFIATNRSTPMFPVTRWSIMAEARDQGGEEPAATLEELCRTYWMPLYAAGRRFGKSPEDAQNLTQEFFARLLEKHWLNAADREKGRSRQVATDTLGNVWAFHCHAANASGTTN